MPYVDYYFEYKFPYYRDSYRPGFTMNKDQDVAFYFGKIITKETLMECEIVDNIVNEGLAKDQITMHKVRFMVDGSSIIHYLASKPDVLEGVLNFIAETKKEYLVAILKKNRFNKNPLELAIDSDSPKSIDLMF